MKDKINELNRYFDENIFECNRRYAELQADDRKDDAVFEKIRANVFGIFKQVLSVATKQCASKPDETYSFFMTRLDAIPSSWETVYNKAQEHGNAADIQIEKLKLDAVCDIRNSVGKIWGDI